MKSSNFMSRIIYEGNQCAVSANQRVVGKSKLSAIHLYEVLHYGDLMK